MLDDLTPAGDDWDRKDPEKFLTSVQVAACETLIHEARSITYGADPVNARTNANRLLIAARICTLMQPAVHSAQTVWSGPPTVLDWITQISKTTQVLEARIGEYDTEPWIDPQVIGGDVADVLDAAIGLVTAWTDLYPTE